MNPPFVITSLKWLPYPENKPERTGRYAVLLTNEEIQTIEWLQTRGEFDPYFNHTVVAFAERSAPFDPTSKRFSFQTALLRMKAGKHVICLASAIKYWFEDGDYGFENIDGYSGIAYIFEIEEIESEWEEA